MSDPDFVVDADQNLPMFQAYTNFWPRFTVTRRDGRTYSVPDGDGSISWLARVTRLHHGRMVLYSVRERDSGEATGFNVYLTSVATAAIRALDGEFLPTTFSSAEPAGLFCLLKAADSVPNLGIRLAASTSPDPHHPTYVSNGKLQPVRIIPRMLSFHGEPVQGPVGIDQPLFVSADSSDIAAVFQDQDSALSTVLWNSGEQFEARAQYAVGETPTSFTELSQLPLNPWVEEPGMADVGYDVQITSGDHTRPGFRVHQPLGVDELSDGRLLFIEPPSVHIRRPVVDQLEVRLVERRLPVYVFDLFGRVAVTGKPARLTLQRIEPEDGVALELEDDWDVVQGQMRIYGGVRLKVGLTYPESPGVPDHELVDTGATVQAMGLVYTAGSMLIDEIFTESSPHENFWQSFSLSLTIDDPTIAEFYSTLPVKEGKHRGRLDLSEILRAVGPGDTTLRVLALALPQPIDASHDEFAPSAEMQIPIHVPPPVEVVLSNYTDRFHGSAGNAALALDSGTAFDVICDHGTLTGEVKNHNPYSSEERVTLKVHTPEGDQPDVDVLSPSAFTTMTGFSTPITNLALVVDDGDNVVTVEAWKPINELVNGGPSVKSFILRAVRPTASALTNALTDATVVRRDIGDVAFTYSKALKGYVWERVGDDTGSAASPEQLASMVSRPVTLQHFRLRAAPGDHRLRAGADNDFDQVSGPEITIHAPAPRVTSNAADWIAQPYRERTRLGVADEVGNSNTSVRVPIHIRYALSASITDESDTTPISPGSNPINGTDLWQTIPRTGNLRVGVNGFSVAATNEFSTETRSWAIRRRGLVYDSDVDADVLTIPDDATIRLHVTRVNLDGSHTELNDSSGRTTLFFNVQNHPSPLGMVGVIIEPFRMVDEDDDGDAETEEPASTDFGYLIRGWATDPDYFHLTPYLVVDPADVVWDDSSFNVASLGDEDAFPGQTFWFSVRIAAFDGSKHTGIAFLPQNY
jgi:hypothetical protein